MVEIRKIDEDRVRCEREFLIQEIPVFFSLTDGGREHVHTQL